ncbi:hypothetical protein E4U58_001292, partial [Claviceps cyperi]
MSDTYEPPQDFHLAFPEFPELPTSRPFASFTELYAFVTGIWLWRWIRPREAIHG